MSARYRRPPPDRSTIVSSMGLPPREEYSEPSSPYYPGGSRSRANSAATRRSERSQGRGAFDPFGEPLAHRYEADPREYDARRSRDDASSRRRGESEPMSRRDSDRSQPRTRPTSSRRPVPQYREQLRDVDEDFDDDDDDRRRPPSRAQRQERSSSTEPPERKLNGRRRQTSDPYQSPEPFEEFSAAPRSDRRSNGVSRKPTDRSSDRDRANDYVERSSSGRQPSQKSGGGILGRVLSRGSSGRNQDADVDRNRRPTSRLVRYNDNGASERGGERGVDLDEIEEEDMLLARERRRSTQDRPKREPSDADRRRDREARVADRPSRRVRNTSDPLSTTRTSRVLAEQAIGVERRPSAVRRSMDRERARTLEALERSKRGHTTKTAAVVQSNGAASTATKAAALAAITGVSASAVAASTTRKPNGAPKPAAPEEDSDSSLDSSLEDAPEPADVRDDEKLPIVIAKVDKSAAPVKTAEPVKTAAPVKAAAPAKAPQTVSDDDESVSQGSDGLVESTEQTSDEPVQPAKAAADRAATDRRKAVSTNSHSAPKGYKEFVRRTPAAAAVAPAASRSAKTPEPDSESESESESEEDEPPAKVEKAAPAPAEESDDEEDEEEAPRASSRAKPAAAAAAVVGAGALAVRRTFKKSDSRGILANADEAALDGTDKEERRAAKIKAMEDEKAAEEEARLRKAQRAEERRKAKEDAALAAEERRKAKEEAAAAAAAGAIAAKEAKAKSKAEAKQAKLAAIERKQLEQSEARDLAIRNKEEAEAQRLFAIREKEREQEEKAELRRQSRRRPHGAKGPKTRTTGVKPLTPQQRHYLLKALVQLQMQSEWSELEKLGALTEYGYPFSSQRSKLTRVKTVERNEDGVYAGSARDPYANEDAMREAENLQEPLILRHLFHVHLHSFPGLDLAPEKYWQKRIQPFFDEMAARNFSTSLERGEISKRRLYSLAATRYLGSFVSRGFAVRGEGETRGPGLGDPGTEKWGAGKNWGKGTVKRGLDKPERIDPDLMARIDGLYEGEGGRVWSLAGRDWSKVRGDWGAFKESIIESETGLETAISYLDVSSIKNLPSHYRNSVEFARIQAAYIFHALFVTAPNADDLYKMVKGIHALAPYWGAKQLLKYANAETMISGILSLLLARPGGAKSLLQRIFSYVIGKEASYIQKEFVEPLRKEIGDPELTKKIEDYVQRGDRIESRRIHTQTQKRGEDVVTSILLSSGPKMSQEVEAHVLELQRCFALSPYRGDLGLAYPENTPAGADRRPIPPWGAQGAEHTRARKFALLKLLLRECLKKRDREQAVEIASGSLIPAIIKDSLETVFYPAIREIASHANLSERLGDLQKFLDDLLETKKNKDDSIEAWIALAARHEQSLYCLFHECASIAKPLWDWCQLGLDYMALSTTDPAHPADRNAPNLEVNFEEMLQDARLTDGDVAKILAEADRLAKYTKWMKVRYELEMRKNYLLARPEAARLDGVSEADLPDAAMKKEIQDIDGMMRDLMEDLGETPDDGVCEDGVRGTEKYDFPWAFFDSRDPLNQHLPAEEEAGKLQTAEPPTNFAPPSLKHIRKLQPLFCELLASKLPEWQSEDVLGQLGKLNNNRNAGGGSKFGLPKRKTRTSFSEVAPATAGSGNKSVMSTSSRFSRFRLPSLFGKK